MTSKKQTAKLPLAAIGRATLHANPGRFYLKKGDVEWVGARHKLLPHLEQIHAAHNGGSKYEVDDRAYIEFRGPETNEGRAAIRAYADANGAVDRAGGDAEAINEKLTVAAVDLVCAMTLSWRLFDEAGKPISLEPHDVDEETGKTQLRLLLEYYIEVAPRKILEMAAFLGDRKNF